MENSINFGYECLTTLGKTKWEHKATSEYEPAPMKVNYGDRWANELEETVYEKKLKIKVPDYRYRHVLEYDIPEDEILSELEWGYCPCCLNDCSLVKHDDATEIISCEDCGSYYFVPESYFETESNPSGLFD